MSKGTKGAATGVAGNVRQLCRLSRDFDDAGAADQRADRAKALLAVLLDVDTLRMELDGIVRDAEAEARKRLLSLEADLKAACDARKWSLQGAWPKFFIEKAIEVAVDEATASVRVAGQRVAPDVDAIVDAAAPIVRGLFPRSFSEQDFLESIVRAVDAVAKPGSGASMAQVYRQLVIDMQPAKLWRDARAETFSPLSLEQLRARFSRTLASTATLKDGRRLTLAPPIDAKDGLFVWQPAEHRFAFIGRLQVVEEGWR